MTVEDATDLTLDFGPSGADLIPVATQDANSLELLVLAFTNLAAFEETLRSGLVTFYSRSRKSLWKKGETSGNFLKVVEIRVNCEQDSLLYLVEQLGEGACHVQKPSGKPYRSCYYRRIENDRKLTIVDS